MDDFLFALLRLLCWPYQAWKSSLENSRIGVSQDEWDTLRFWKRFALFGSLLVLAALAGAVLYFVFGA